MKFNTCDPELTISRKISTKISRLTRGCNFSVLTNSRVGSYLIDSFDDKLNIDEDKKWNDCKVIVKTPHKTERFNVEFVDCDKKQQKLHDLFIENPFRHGHTLVTYTY